MDVLIAPGFAENQRNVAARLFWQAFRDKLGALMRPDTKALRFLENVIDPAHSISATAPDGTLLGLAGYKTENGGFVGGELADLARVYGWLGTLWRAPFLSQLERGKEPDTLLMDGIFVSETARGMGIGTRLLDAIQAEATIRNLARVRLDVIDSNPRARALYERCGFVAGKTEHIGPLRHLFGFSSATTMTWTAVAPEGP